MHEVSEVTARSASSTSSQYSKPTATGTMSYAVSGEIIGHICAVFI
jgi:hypothetical protein